MTMSDYEKSGEKLQKELAGKFKNPAHATHRKKGNPVLH